MERMVKLEKTGKQESKDFLEWLEDEENQEFQAKWGMQVFLGELETQDCPVLRDMGENE
jgi:hypothetical protein